MDTKTRQVMHSSENETWNTPERVLVLVRAIAGGPGIGLDPCSNATSLVGAKVELALERGEDGLALSWSGYGLVYVNSPYGRELNPWSHKIVSEARAGVEIVALVPARTDTGWFNRIWKVSTATCFVRGRLTFVGAPAPAPFPSAVFYTGPRVQRFATFFKGLGRVLTS